MRTLRTKLRRDLARQKAPFVAVAVTVLLGVGLFAASYDAYRNLSTSYEAVFARLSTPDYWITGGDIGAIARDAGALDGVAGVDTRVLADVPLRVGRDKLLGRVISTGDDLHPAVADLAVLAGSPSGADPVAAEQHMAEHFDLAPGDTVEVLGEDGRWRPVTVDASVASAEYLWPTRDRQQPLTLPDEFGVLLTTDRLATELTGRRADQVLVRYAPGADTDALDERLAALARAAGAADHYPLERQPSNDILQEDVSGFSQMAFLFPALFLTAAGMASYVLLSRRVRSERAIIGTLRAAGTARGAVLRHYLAYGVTAGLAGGVPGLVLGLWGATSLSRVYTDFIDLPFTEIAFHPETVVIGLAFGAGTGALAAWAPARKAAATAPAEAMRGIVPAAGGGRTWLERLLPGSARLPIEWRMVLRSIGRNRRRSAITAGGVVLALLLVLVSWSMLDTVNQLADEQFGRLDASDAQVRLTGPHPAAVLPEIADVAGVDVVEPLTVAAVTLVGPAGTYATRLIAPPVDTRLRSFDVVAGEASDLSTRGVLLGAPAREELGVEVGEDVTLRIDTPGGPQSVTLPVAAFVSQPVGTFAYVDRAELAAALGSEQLPVTGAQLTFAAGADPDAVRRAVSDLPAVAAFQSSAALQQLIDDAMGLFYAFIAAMLAAGAMLAAAVIFTTQSVSISERATEVATLRASGVRLREIARMITGENILVTLSGVVPGLVLGVLGGRLMLQTYSNDQFTLDFVVQPTTLALSAGALLLVALASQVPGLRALRRLDLATTVRERAT